MDGRHGYRLTLAGSAPVYPRSLARRACCTTLGATYATCLGGAVSPAARTYVLSVVILVGQIVGSTSEQQRVKIEEDSVQRGLRTEAHPPGIRS